MTKKKRLGRGLDALLSKPAIVAATVAAEQSTTVVEGTAMTIAKSANASDSDLLRNIPVDLLERGKFQPRVDMRQESLEELASSINAQGVVQPIVARPVNRAGETQRYEIVAGERRWRAAQMAGLQEIPAIVRDVPDGAAIAMALIENIQREDLNPLEESRALDRLIREFQLTHQEAADAVGRSRASVSNLLRLQELADKVQQMLETRQLDMGHARALLAITDKLKQMDVAKQVVKNQLSVRATENLIRRIQAGATGSKGTRPGQPVNGDIQRLEMDISDKLGAKTRIDHSKKGHGKLIIAYNSLDELDGILKHIK